MGRGATLFTRLILDSNDVRMEEIVKSLSNARWKRFLISGYCGTSGRNSKCQLKILTLTSDDEFSLQA